MYLAAGSGNIAEMRRGYHGRAYYFLSQPGSMILEGSPAGRQNHLNPPPTSSIASPVSLGIPTACVASTQIHSVFYGLP